MTVLQPFPRTSPESVGIPSAAIEAFLNQLEHNGIELHRLIILRHGRICAEGCWKPYSSDQLHNIFSFTKTFAGSAIGILISEGKLTLEDPVLSFFPEDAPKQPSQNLQKMKVRHLLSMSTGHHQEPAVGREKNLPKAFLSYPVEHEPGTWFAYNSAASEMLGRIVKKITGQDFLSFLEDRLFKPMGFGKMDCFCSGDGLPSAGGGMALSAEDMCRLPQLYLQHGEWNGKQLVPREWIETATLPQCDNSNGTHTDGNEDWEAGYGYQMWMNAPAHSYRFDGAFGQEALVCPDQDLIVLFNANTFQLAETLRFVWRFILANVSDTALPENPGAWEHLRKRLTDLRLPELIVKGTSWMQGAVNGKEIQLSKNEFVPFYAEPFMQTAADSGLISVTPLFHGDSLTLKLKTAEHTYELTAGMDQEARCNIISCSDKELEIYASAKWTDQNVLSVTWRAFQLNRISSMRIVYHLEDTEVTLSHHLRGIEITVKGQYEETL